jgi:signal transduction histidine kinase
VQRLRLQHRLVIPFIAVAVAGTSAAAFVAVSVASGAMESRVRTQLAGAAGVVSRADFALNRNILVNLQEVINAQVITFGPGGTVVASTGAAQGLVETVRGIVTASAPSTRDATAVRADCGEPCLVVYRAVQDRPGYVVALVADTSDLAASTRALSRAILLAAGLSIVAIVLVSGAVARYVTAPLQRLVRFARELSPGDSRQRAEVGDDEVGALAEAFNGMLDRLETAQAALVRSEKLGLAGLMAARVAHDIRNPLSSIKMQAQLLRARLRDDGEDRAMVTSVLHDIEQVESVIRDLLELGRPGELRLEPTPIALVVQEALQQLAAQFAHRKISVVTRLDERLPPVLLDSGRFKQALLNVLNNASEAMPTGGTITIGSRLDGESAVVLQICDDGVGIDPALIDRVFDPFVSTKRDGMGLGLVNVKAVVEGHGGRIALAPNAPKGTCTSIVLPVPSRGEGVARTRGLVSGP